MRKGTSIRHANLPGFIPSRKKLLEISLVWSEAIFVNLKKLKDRIDYRVQTKYMSYNESLFSLKKVLQAKDKVISALFS